MTRDHHRRAKAGLSQRKKAENTERIQVDSISPRKHKPKPRCPKCYSANTKFLSYPTLGRIIGGIFSFIVGIIVSALIWLPHPWLLFNLLEQILPHWKCKDCGHEWFRPLFSKVRSKPG